MHVFCMHRMLGDITPFKIHLSQFNVFGRVAQLKVTIIALKLCVHVYL
jgi:hypothetical protein